MVKSWLVSKEFWVSSTERAVKTLAEFVIALGAANGLNILNLDWSTVIGLGIGGAVLSYAASIISATVAPKGTPSLVREGDAQG